MTVRELIKKLSAMPADATVVIATQNANYGSEDTGIWFDDDESEIKDVNDLETKVVIEPVR